MALATADDVRTRLGRDLTAEETSQATALIASVTALIAEATATTVDAVEAIDPVPSGLKVVAVEVTVRVLLNPQGVSSSSETIGQHSRSRAFSGGPVGLELTRDERLRVRRAIKGTLTASARAGTLADDIADATGYADTIIAGELLT